MKSARILFLAVAACAVLAAGLRADQDAPAKSGAKVTLKGEIMCAKCELKEKGLKKCQTVIQVKEDGKAMTYYFNDKGAREEYHEEVCGGGRKEATVTGVVAVKDGKKWITPDKVVYAKQ